MSQARPAQMRDDEETRRLPIYLQVADRSREAIIAGTLAPGDALPTERELAESFQVSRASVREALRALQAQGLVSATGPPARTVVVPGAGAHARDALVTLLRLNGVGVRDLMSFRALLEGEALAEAARRRPGIWIEHARAALDVMHRPGLSAREYEEADVHFHMALVRGSGNEAMFLVMSAIRGAVGLHLLEHLEGQADLQATLTGLTAEHDAILAAVEDNEPGIAQRRVRAHIAAFYGDG
jgi:GntR family transcriptional regulator, transcriptional repressor for pyruvate dehydrogenase complex